MRRLFLYSFLWLFACSSENISNDPQQAANKDVRPMSLGSSSHAIMHLSGDEIKQWQARRAKIAPANFDSDVRKWLKSAKAAGVATSVNLLPYLSYPAKDRIQGNCGNCWVWGSTAAAEIILGVHGIKDALSVQYFGSNYLGDSGWACCGGDLIQFTEWYQDKKFFVPMTNDNAAFADAKLFCEAGKSKVRGSSIATFPNYSITSIAPVNIVTTGVGQQAAIDNIKNILNQNRPVTYSFLLPNKVAWDDFQNYWDNESESVLWNPDVYAGMEYTTGGGGHLVTIVGYDDTDSNPGNHYWIVANSWGVTNLRPNNLFRLAQRINYDAVTTYSNLFVFDMNIFESMNIDWSTDQKLSIDSHPQSVTAALGMPATFKVVGSGGTTPYTYAWRKNGDVIAEATSASYTISAVSYSDEGKYDVVVSDSASNSVISQDASLTVVACTPDCDGKMCGSDGCGGSCGSCSGSQKCDASGKCAGGTCSHPLCSTGPKLSIDCDKCVSNVCAIDKFCCSNAWDSLCVMEVSSVCEYKCDCVPSCEGKTCGDDGCGGDCGYCTGVCDRGNCILES